MSQDNDPDNCPYCFKPLDGDEPVIILKQKRSAVTCNKWSKIRKLDVQVEVCFMVIFKNQCRMLIC